MEEKTSIVAKVLLNVAGKPKEHVDGAMKTVIDNIESEKQVKIIKKKIMKAQKKEDIYFSAVAELDIKCDDAYILMGFCLDYMPSSVEIIEPEEIDFSSQDLTGLLNDMLSKLHNVNLSVGQIKSENDLMKQNGEHLLKNIIMLSIKEKPKKIEQMAGDIGIKPEALKPFVEKYVKEGRIKKKEDTYLLGDSLY